MTETQNSTGLRAIITGASGMVGRGVLLECLDSPRVTAVLVINRAPIGVSHPKMIEVIHSDFTDLSPLKTELAGYDVLFFCAGVSAIGKSEAEYTTLTYDLTLAFAQQLLAINPGLAICYVTGAGTDSSEQGPQMWARVKGRTENALFAMPFGRAYMFRPGVIQPLKGVRAKSKWINLTYALFKPLIWLIKIIFPHSITTSAAMGQAMINAVARGHEKQHLGNREINLLAMGVSVASKEFSRKAWLGCVLTLMMPGLGHIYNGRLKKGLVIYFLYNLISIGALSTLLIRSLIPINMIFVVFLIISIEVFLIAQVVSYAKTEGKEYKLKPFNRWYIYLAMIALGIYVIGPSVRFILRANLLESYFVPTGAMENTILVGDLLFGDMRKSNITTLEQGDVVIFKYPNSPKDVYVKRLIAGPGQTVEIRNREIFVDGEPFFHPEHLQFINPRPQRKGISDPKIFPRGNGNRDHYSPIRIPAAGDTLRVLEDRFILLYIARMDGYEVHVEEGETIVDGQIIEHYVVQQDYYFMMGDNRDQSFDSRFWGFVPHKYLRGEVLFVYFSVDRKRFPSVTLSRLKRIGTIIR